MSDWIDHISDHDEAESERKQTVGRFNTRIWDSLFAALKSRVSRYNVRHPSPGVGFPDPVTIVLGPFASTEHTARIEKNTEPKSALDLEFPINSGQMKFGTTTSGRGGTQGLIQISFRGEEPVFSLMDQIHNVDGLADALLRPVLDPWGVVQQTITERFTGTTDAATELEQNALHTAANELRQADGDLKRSPQDLTGAVQHSLAALECVTREYCGEHSTFGKLLERYPDLFPKPLNKGMEGIWGFASEMGRHLREGRTPQREEVELLFGLAGVCCAYLARKLDDQ